MPIIIKNFQLRKTLIFIGSYVFLYSALSIITSDLLIQIYEKYLTNLYIHSQYFYFSKPLLEQLKNISTLILYPNSSISSSEKLHLFRKELLLNDLLQNFRSQNYINVDSFIIFSAKKYHEALENIIESSIEFALNR